MGGIAECGVSNDTKSSPRRVAIEKAQEELRQEFDVREERRRELEFLEKGGNPLDFKLGHVASLSVQSTSVTDQIAEQNVISEAKGSFAFAASPHGDSVESSGKPGSSSYREANIADNLMLLDGDTSNIGGEKVVKRGTKRNNTAQPDLSLRNDGQSNTKEAEDSGLFRLGSKNQAYARRRSKSTRENAHTVSARSLSVPPLSSQRKDAKGVIEEAKTDDHGVSSISGSKPTSPNGNNMLKNASLDNQVAVEMDSVQEIHGGNQVEKLATTNERDVMQAFEISPNSVTDNSRLTGTGHIATAVASIESCDAIPKEASSRTSSFPSTSNEIMREAHNPEKAGNGSSYQNMVDAHTHSMDNNGSVPHPAIETTSLSVNEVDLARADATGTIDELSVKNGTTVSVRIGEKSDENVSNIAPYDKDDNKDSQLDGSSRPTVVDDSTSVQLEFSNAVKHEIEFSNNVVDVQKDTGYVAISDNDKVNKEAGSDLDRNNSCSNDCNVSVKLASATMPPEPLTDDIANSAPSMKNPVLNLDNDVQKSSGTEASMENKEPEDSILANKEYEDSILRKARLIEVNIKRAGERSLCNISLEKMRKSHWEFVLEEMAWMANDFMQERLWKNAAAAQTSHWIAFSGRAKFEEATIRRKQKSVARLLAKGIMNFWHSAETSRDASGEIPKARQIEKSNGLVETKLAGAEAEKEQVYESFEQEKSRLSHQSPIQSYALRFLEYNCNMPQCLSLAEAPPTPDRLNDFGILKVPDQLSEVNLFYQVAPSEMRAYRESVERLFLYNKKVSNSGLKDDYEPSTCGSVADLHRENVYEDDEGEACPYLFPGSYDGSLTSKLSHRKKHPMLQRMNDTRRYDAGVDMPYDPSLESKSGNHQFLSNGKRQSDFLSVPTKRIRTAVRQRVASPYSAAVAGTPQFTNKTDASSGDTNSCQDDHSSLHGGSFPRKNVDIESTVDFDRRLLYDGGEVSTKTKKKKKPKHPGHKMPQNVAESCTLMAGKKDYLKKRSDTHQFDSNGNIVINGQHAAKKPKLMNQGADISLEAVTPVGSVASPVASQMSNMANPMKIIKIITNRDRARKNKPLKVAAVRSGPGSPWSSFEDQALVVLVHDMGQNWELVSDALNSILQLKCISRKPIECKDRHKLLTDGDAADSADDSGSSQHYQSTLPGIPKGSARQLFQRLQGPFEEETLKAHFEKIIFLGQKMYPSRRQGERQELKQINPLHTSHILALSQACPSNISGGVLTPLDLCDAIASNSDALSVGYPGSHTGGLILPNHHGSIGPNLPTSNVNARLPGSPGMVLGNNLPSPSTLNAPPRDAQRYGVPRPTSVQFDEQQRIHYNQMLNGRNLQQPGVSVSGALPAGVDRGVRMMPGAHGVGMMTGLNRGTPVTRPGFPRLGSPGMLNMVSSGNMLPNNGQSMQNTVNVHPSARPGPGNTVLRPCDPMQMLRPGQNLDERRQMMQEFQMQVSQGNSQAVHFSGTPFSNSGASSPVQSFPVQQSQPHQMPQQTHMFGNTHNSHIQGTSQSSPQQQAYAMHLAKERHIQQSMMSQQQHPLSGASAVPTVQNGLQMQQQGQGSASSPVSSSQSQHKQQHPAPNPQDSLVLSNQPASTASHKQKKQQGQQQSRQNQQQRNQGTQQAKLMKSLGRGNMMHQSPPVDATHASGISTTSKNQASDKNSVQQGSGYFAGNKGMVPSMPQPGNQSKIYASQISQSPIQASDTGNQGLSQGSPSKALLPSQQAPLHSASSLATPAQQQQQQRYMNSSQNNIQRLMMQQNRHMNTDGRIELVVDQVQHNQVIPSTSIARSTDSGSPGVSSLNQRKLESALDPTSVTSTSQLSSSPQDTFVGNESLLSATGQGMLQRQMSGGVPIHGHGIGGHRQQQQSRQQQQQQQSQRQRAVVQGSVFAHTSNSGPG